MKLSKILASTTLIAAGLSSLMAADKGAKNAGVLDIEKYVIADQAREVKEIRVIEKEKIAKRKESKPAGLYLGIKGGANIVKPFGVDANYVDSCGSCGCCGSGPISVFIQDSLKSKSGFFIAGAIGFKVNESVSIEAEYAQRDNRLDRFTVDNFNVNGKVKSESYMLNAIVSIPTDSKVSPFLGAGLGLNNLKMNGSTNSVYNSSWGLNNRVKVNGGNSSLAYQGIAGIKFNVSKNAALTTEYRYFRADGEHNYDFVTDSDEVITSYTNDKAYVNHSVAVGLQLSF